MFIDLVASFYPTIADKIGSAACLADSSKYQFFADLAERVTEAFGKAENICRALAVAKECWRLRATCTRDDQTYDWRDAMRSLGTPLLLF
jgi:hypothetical protein